MSDKNLFTPGDLVKIGQKNVLVKIRPRKCPTIIKNSSQFNKLMHDCIVPDQSIAMYLHTHTIHSQIPYQKLNSTQCNFYLILWNKMLCWVCDYDSTLDKVKVN